MRKRILVSILAVVLLLVCGYKWLHRDRKDYTSFAPVAYPTKMVIQDGLPVSPMLTSKTTKTATSVVEIYQGQRTVTTWDPKRIRTITDYINRHRKGWTAPGLLDDIQLYTHSGVTLYDGEKMVGYFGVGWQFFQTNLNHAPYGQSYTVSASEGDMAECVRLLGVKEPPKSP